MIKPLPTVREIAEGCGFKSPPPHPLRGDTLLSYSGVNVFMAVDEEDYERVMQTLERGQEKLEDLREQREQLIEANQKLVKLVKKLQNTLEDIGEDVVVETEDHRYSFEDGWKPMDVVHEEDLDIGPDPDLEDIDDQVNEVIRAMKRAQKFRDR